MKEVKGFQKPDPKGKDMLRGEDGPWKLYQRGPSYRIGRKAWWGIKWFRTCGFHGSLFMFQTQSRDDAEGKLKEENKKLIDSNWYKMSKWEVKK